MPTTKAPKEVKFTRMKKFIDILKRTDKERLLPLIPILLSLFMIIKEYLNFVVVALPKISYVQGREINVFNDIELTFYYGPSMIVFGWVLIVLSAITIINAVFKKKINTAKLLVVVSMVCIYGTSMINSSSRYLHGLALFADSQNEHVKYVKNISEKIRSCDLTNCINKK